jgi:hypothetical protein
MNHQVTHSLDILIKISVVALEYCWLDKNFADFKHPVAKCQIFWWQTGWVLRLAIVNPAALDAQAECIKLVDVEFLEH